jgi:hypothetical protein
MRDCAKKCYMAREGCEKRDCRLHIEFPEDHNCTLIAS